MNMKANLPPVSETLRRLSRPDLVQVDTNLVCARFELMKFTPARKILETALASGNLRPQGHVIESSSGTFAQALAILCAHFDLRLTLVTGPVSQIVRWRLESLGARLHIVEASSGCEGGIQQARLHMLHEILERNPDAFWPQQYTNPLNGKSYEPIARMIYRRHPDLGVIAGSVGSGGSLFGIGGALRQWIPELKIVGVDHNRSVIFGAEPLRITRMCRDTFERILAMGAGIPMGNVVYPILDELHWMPIPDMIRTAHAFHAETANLIGPSGGAALKVAKWELMQGSARKVLAILPDHGMRYTDTLYNPQWLDEWSEDMAVGSQDPIDVRSPREVGERWSRMMWSRRSFEEVLGHAPKPRPEGFNP